MDGSAPSDLDAADPGAVPPRERRPAPTGPAGPARSSADPIRTSPSRLPNIADYWPDARPAAAAADAGPVMGKAVGEGARPAAAGFAAGTPAGTSAAGTSTAGTPAAAAGDSVTARFASRVSVTLGSLAPGAVAPGAVTPGTAPTGAFGTAATGAVTPGAVTGEAFPAHAVTEGADPTGVATGGAAAPPQADGWWGADGGPATHAGADAGAAAPHQADGWWGADGDPGTHAGAQPVGAAAPATDAGSAPGPAPLRHRPDAVPTGVPGMPATAGAGSGAYPITVLGPPARAGRHRLRMLVALVGAAVFLGVSVLVLVRLVDRPEPDPVAQAPAGDGGIVVASPSPPVSIAPAPTSAATPSVGPSAPSAPPGTRPPGPAFAAGTFVLAGDLTELNVSVGRPPRNGIARVFSPRDSGVRPRADVDGTTVRLTSEPAGEHGSGQVDVLLDERIAWTITMAGGVRRGVFAMVGAEVRGFELDGGADRLVMTLPRQADPIPIRMSGGVHTWRIRTDGRVPVTAVLRRGAGEVELNGDRERGVDKGETLRAPGRGDGAGGVRVEAVAGVGSLTVEPLHQGD